MNIFETNSYLISVLDDDTKKTERINSRRNLKIFSKQWDSLDGTNSLFSTDHDNVTKKPRKNNNKNENW